MKPEPKIMVAIMSAITAYIQQEQRASGVSAETTAKHAANQSSTRA